jgi:hypothetical protein
MLPHLRQRRLLLRRHRLPRLGQQLHRRARRRSLQLHLHLQHPCYTPSSHAHPFSYQPQRIRLSSQRRAHEHDHSPREHGSDTRAAELRARGARERGV